MAKNQVVVSILSDASKFGKGLDSASKSAGRFGGGFKIGLAVAAGAALAVAAGLGKAIKAAKEAEVVYKQTEAVLTSTGGAAGRTAAQLDKQAVALSKLSGIDDVVIRKGQNMLLTFTEIQGITFDRATESALDMSIALGTDLTSASQTLGKALNDPLAGISKLTKQGVVFTDAQKKQIEMMVKAGDVAGAQGVILDEVAREFGGSAAKFGESAEGAEQRMKSAFGRIQVSIGSIFLPVIAKFFSTVAGLLDRIGESKWFQAFISNVGAFINSLVSGDSAVGEFVLNIIRLATTLSPVHVILQALAPILPQLAATIGVVATAIGGALSDVLIAVAPLLELLATAAGDIVVQLLPLIVAVLQLVSPLLRLTEPLLQLVGPLLTPLIELLIAVLGPVLALIQPILGLLVPALQILADGLGLVIGWVSSALKWLVQLATGNKKAGQQLREVWNGIKSFFGTIGQFFANIWSGLVTGVSNFIGDVMRNLGQIRGKVVGVFNGAVGWLAGIGRNIIDGLVNGLSRGAGAVASKLLSIAKGAINAFKSFFGIHSPSRLMGKMGDYINQGLGDGITKNIGVVKKAVGKLNTAVTDTFTASLDAGTASLTVTGDNTSAGTRVYNITVHAVTSSVETGRAIVNAIRDYERFEGGQPA